MIQCDKKRTFNVKSKKDLAVYKNFLQTGNWGSICPFILEFPYLSVPHMINKKIVDQYLKIS